MKKILVTGSNGQLGNELRELEAEYPDFSFFFTDIQELDICDADKLDSFIADNQIDYIINCAAYTAVDKAETEKELAKKINIDAVNNLAKLCQKHDVGLIHISTDYVFDGMNYRPYLESDPIRSNSYYGYTKEEGERLINKYNINAVIIRTSWLYSSYGSNFVKTITKYAKERESLNVVFDQVGTPTYAADLAKSILEFIVQDKVKEIEIYHFSNEGVCSWYDFAKVILEMQNIECFIYPIEGKDYPAPANRPYYSVFNKDKIKKTLGIEIPYWKDSLRVCLYKLNQQ